MLVRKRFGSSSLGALLMLAVGVGTPVASSSIARAGDPPVTEPPPGETGKPLQGKGFTLDKFENSLWTPEKKKSEVTKSEARKRKIESLKELASNPTYANKAEAFFRLAETHWQEAKFRYFLEREKYEAAVECFESKRCPSEPVEPNEDQSTAIDFYRKVLQADPNYERLDQVTYFLGRAAIESGKAKSDRQLQLDGEKYLKDVATKWPKSPLVPEAHLTLAEYYFEKDSLYFAKTNYEAIIQKFPSHAMYNYALYKLGWVYFNLTEFEKTIDTFHKVIAAIKGRETSGLIDFREQALNDLIQAYAEVDNGWREARDYFMKEVGEQSTYEKLDKMAALLVTKDKDEEAIDLYKHLVGHDRTTPKVAEWYDAVMEVRRKINDVRETEKEINEVTEVFDPKGAWYLANKDNTAAVDKANDIVSGGLSFIANAYHKDAQTAEKNKKMAEATPRYDTAAKYYAKFLDRFPDHPDSYKFNFYFAEILFDRQKYVEAGEQYEKTLAKDLKGEFVEDAALGVVYSMESELDRQGVRKKPKGEIEKVVISADVRDKEEDAEIKETPLHALEARMIKAADRYVEVLSKALKDPEFIKKYPGRGEKIPNMMYVSAEIFYQHGQFKESVTRLQVIFDLFPNHEFASYAVNLIISAYKRVQNWVKIEEWAREVIKKKNFSVRKKEEWEQISAIAKTEHARNLTKQRQYDEAIKVQQEIVDEFGKKNRDVASKALFNVGAIHEIARRFPEAVTAYEDVIKRYKDMDIAVEAQAAIGVLYENQTEFEKAAEADVGMQQFKSLFKNNEKVAKRAAEAYRDAGVLYVALESYDRAHEVFENYTKLYPNRPDVPAVAFESAQVLEYKNTPEAFDAAGKGYEKVARAHGRKDAEYELRAVAAAALAYKKADKLKNRRKVEGLLRTVAASWDKLQKAAAKSATPLEFNPATKAYAALASFESAEYLFDDYSALKVEAVSKSGNFEIATLVKTLKAKAEALLKAQEAFGKVLDFKDKGMAAASAFRIGKTYDEFYDNLMNAPSPPGLTEEQIDEYRFALEENAAPAQEKALKAFSAALRQAVKDGVYNKWSRLSAIYAAKVNKDEFPIAEFSVQPDKTRDTVLATSFIKQVRRGSVVVDYLNQTTIDTHGKPEGGAKPEPGNGEPTKGDK